MWNDPGFAAHRSALHRVREKYQDFAYRWQPGQKNVERPVCTVRLMVLEQAELAVGALVVAQRTSRGRRRELILLKKSSSFCQSGGNRILSASVPP
jgi:hypothetical protein